MVYIFFFFFFFFNNVEDQLPKLKQLAPDPIRDPCTWDVITHSYTIHVRIRMH
jgi:hypothetical protein